MKACGFGTAVPRLRVEGVDLSAPPHLACPHPPSPDGERERQSPSPAFPMTTAAESERSGGGV